MRDRHRRCVRKGVIDQENPSGAKKRATTAAQIVGRTEKYSQPISQQGQTNAEMEQWDTVMREQLGEDASHNQPYRLREKIHPLWKIEDQTN